MEIKTDIGQWGKVETTMRINEDEFFKMREALFFYYKNVKRDNDFLKILEQLEGVEYEIFENRISKSQ